MNTKRTFIATKIIFNNELVDIHKQLKFQLMNEKINWVDFKNIHLTYKFLGDTTNEQINKIISNLNQLSNEFQPFEICFNTLGVFNNFYNPKVIWFGIIENQKIKEIAKSIDNKCSTLGFLSENRDFKPHLTIARIKFLKDKKNLKKVVEKYSDKIYQIEIIKKIQLFKSILSPLGPKYNLIHEIVL